MEEIVKVLDNLIFIIMLLAVLSFWFAAYQYVDLKESVRNSSVIQSRGKLYTCGERELK